MPEYETQDFPEVADALQDILEQYKNNGWIDLRWRGPDKLHYSIAATCPEPSWLFSDEGREQAQGQGRDFMDVFIMVAFQLGYHNGRCQEIQKNAGFL